MAPAEYTSSLNIPPSTIIPSSINNDVKQVIRKMTESLYEAKRRNNNQLTNEEYIEARRRVKIIAK